MTGLSCPGTAPDTGHLFHTECIRRAALVNDACPVCRAHSNVFARSGGPDSRSVAAQLRLDSRLNAVETYMGNVPRLVEGRIADATGDVIDRVQQLESRDSRVQALEVVKRFREGLMCLSRVHGRDAAMASVDAILVVLAEGLNCGPLPRRGPLH